MNAKCYRTVFNAVRGMLVAVEETASSTGKGRNAGRRASALTLSAVAALAAPGLNAQSLTPDRNVPGPHPVVGVAANGTPVVNINAPSAGGVSSNAFTNYNVGQAGVVLNNSGQNSQTQIAGWVQGNPFLGNTAARVILNQVTSGNPSTLAGPTEIAGNQASLIVANPAGITCAGCSFIQAPRVTLTTGTPNFDALGNISSISVQQGQITVNGAGLDARGAQLDLLSRAMAINGQVWAERLNAVAGANNVDYGSVTPTAIAGVGPAPQVAIDVGQLGSMYGGGATRLIGTEQGLGVNIGGNLAALTGSLSLAANGDVTITPTGRVQSAADASISAPNVSNQGVITSPGNVTVSGSTTNTGTLVAGGNATLTGPQIANSGTIGAGVDTNGNVTQPGAVALNATGAVRNSGNLLAGQSIGVTGASIDASNGNVATQGTVSLSATGDVATRSATISGGSVAVQAGGTLDNTAGSLSSNTTLQVGAQRVVNQSGLLASTGNTSITTGSLDNTSGALGSNSGSLTINSTGDITNAKGKLVAAQDVSIAGGSLGNQGGTVSAQNLSLNTGAGAVDNSGGTVSAAGTANVTAGSLVNQGGTLAAAGDVSAHVASLDNTSGVLGSSSGTLNVNSSGAIKNASGKLVAAQDVTLAGTSFGNQAGAISARNLALNTGAGAVDNSGGSMAASGTANVQAGNLVNRGGTLAATGDVTTTVASVDNTGGALGSNTGNLTVNSAGSIANASSGKLIAAQDVTLNAAAIGNQAGIVSGRNLSLNAGTGAIDNTNGTVSASGVANVQAGNLVNQGGTLAANGNVHATVASLDNTSGVLGSSAGNLKVDSSGAITSTNGKLIAAQDATFNAASLSNQGGAISARNLLVNTGSGTVDNTNGQVSASGTADLTAGSLVNRGGTLASAGDMAATVASVDNTGGALGSSGNNLVVNSAGNVTNANGKLIAGQDATLNAVSLGNQAGTISARNLTVNTGTGTVDNTSGTVSASGVANVTAGSLVNQLGTLAGAGNVTANVASLDNASGVLGSSAGALNVTSTGNIGNAGGKLLAAQDATLAAASMGNQAGTVSGQNVTLNTGTGALDNTAGKVSAANTLQLTAGVVTNQGGTLAATGDVHATVASLDNTAGGILGSGQGGLTLTSAGNVANAGGKLLATQDIQLQAASLGNQGGTVSGRNVTVNTGTGALDNTGGAIASTAALDATAGAVTNANGGVMQAGTTLTTHSQSLANTKGAVIGNAVSVNANTLTNQQGTISSNTTLDVQSQTLTNDQGKLVSNGVLTVNTGTLTNAAGQVASNSDVTVNGTTVDNSAGLMHSGGTLTVSGANLVNKNTNTATTGMEGANVALTATTLLDNTAGAIRSDLSTQLTAPSINNSLGSIQSAGTVGAKATAALTNTQGNLNGTKSVGVTAGRMSGDGTVQSQGSVSLNLQSDYNNSGTLAAGQDVSVTTTGNVTNSGTMSAGRNLAVSANNITNTQTGQLIGTVSNTLTAQGTLSNDGLIDGGATVIRANNVVNTGRLYGDSVSIAANTLTNTVNGNGVAGVIASRGDMDLGVQTLNNQEHALIYAIGNMRVGGALDANNHATGSAQNVTNGSATINADGNLTIAASQINNQNNHFATTDQTSPGTHVVSYRLNGSTQEIDPSTIRLFHQNTGEAQPGANWQWLGDDDYKVMLLPSAQYPFERYGPPFDYSYYAGGAVGIAYKPEQPCWQDSCTVSSYPEEFLYKTTDRIWSVFGITPPQEIGTQPDPTTYQPSQYPQYQADLAAWQQRHDAAVAQYQVLNDAITAFNTNVRSRQVDAFNIYDGTQQVTRTVVTQSDPGMITSGGNMTLNAGVVNNVASQIVAGGDLTGSNVIGTRPNNVGMTGTQTVTTTGTAMYTYVDGRDRAYNTSPWAGQTIQTNYQLDVSPTNGTGPNSQPTVKSVAVTTKAGVGNGGGASLADYKAIGGDTVQPGSASVTVPNSGILHIQTSSVATPATGSINAATTSVTLPGNVVIRTVVPNLTLPNNALYRIISDPGSSVLVETDPRFTNFRQWTSSDTMLSQFHNDPGATLKRIGDGFYEQQLIQQQIVRATGQRFIGDYTNNEDEYKALLANGTAAGKAFGLNVGTALTEAQMAQLTSDIVWLVKQTVTLADGSKQEVLVPQVYLRAKDTDITGGGTLMAGNNVSFNAKGDATNSGTIASRNVTVVTADNIVNTGTLAGSTLLAQATQDINNLGGHIQGDQVLLSAGRDVNLTSTTVQTKNITTTGTNINQVASIDAGALSIQAGRDANLAAVAINTTGNATITANRDVNLTAVRQSNEEHVVWGDKNRSDRSSYADAGTQIQTGGNLAIGAGRDVNATAAYANATGGIQVAAGRDVNLNAGQSHQDVRDEHFQTEKGFLSTKTTHTIDSAGQTNAVGTTLSGDTVTVAAGRDLTAKAATIAGTGDVNLAAGNNLTITTADTATNESHFKDVKKSGLGSAGAGISYGTNQVTDTSNDTVRGSQGSLIGSTDGSVHMQAGKDLHITGSDVVAGQNVTGIAQNVTIDASTTDRHHDNTHETKSSGFTLAVKSPILDAIQNVQQQAEAAGNSQDKRAAALHGIAAASAVADLGATAGAMATKPEAKIELSWGSQSSKTTQTEDSTQHNGSNIKAGGTAAFVATGDGTPGSGNVNIAGSDVNAKNVLLQANNQVNLRNSTDTDSTRSTYESKSASFGVSYGTGGFGVSASMSKAHGDANSDAQTQNNTHINASDTVTIVSGGDTNIVGANVNANKVLADIGGNLNVASTQDTSHSTSHQESTSGGFSASMGGGSANFSHSSGNANGNYAGVNEQSGIQAGAGGFDINVKGNTDLKGAVIASTATPDKNQLTTGTLTFSDIQNHSGYSASSGGFSLSGSLGNGGDNYKKPGETKSRNVGGGAPMLSQNDSGSESATTRSAISQGTINITDKANQKQDVASLSRDTTNTNGTVSKTPDLQNLLNNQADMMSAAQAAGQAVAQRIGDYADGKKKEAEGRLAQAQEAYKNDPSDANQAAINAAQSDINSWKEGGLARAGMQAAGAAAVAGLGGGNALAAGAGAGLSSLAAGKLNELSSAIAGSSPTGNKNVDEALGNIVSNALATTLGGAVGGNAGAFSGYNVDRFNRQLHPDEQKWIKDNAKRFAQQQGISEQDAEQRLAQQGFRQVQNGVGGATDQAASNFLQQARGMLAPDPSCAACGLSYMFQATKDQKANTDMYANFLPQDRQNWFYMQNGLTQPGKETVVAANQRAQTINNVIGGATIGAPVATALLVGAPVATATSGIFALATIGGSVGGGMDAAGQYAQSGTIRPVQSIFATATGAVTGPIGAQVGFVNNILLGGVGGAVNTAFNNVYYGENNNVGYAAAVGGLAGGAGYFLGWATTLGLTQVARPIVFPSPLQPNVPAVLQGFRNPMPGLAGATGGSIVQGTASFVPGYENK
ncbi:hemagglutinin repeat-containing protein [Ralstonia sp. CHL-2022]|uniref:Hemagglutinin repeat-containing protein n=2 Tax=Pseudomonadota TaxID=1224 RepID=A0ABT2L7R6_9RALS|nr:hemagglutinin repeat-containing protein [Ralstonia mojiangensis]MCT7310758.1 hemagglutinin repeat-containing protein [Ralstonia mojiangensis]